MKTLTALTLLLAVGSALAAPFSGGDAQAGKKLFDQYQCNRCHIDKMGGDGSAIFTRPDRKVTSPQEMIEQLKKCSENIGKTLSAQEQQNLGAYLNQHYYKFR